MRSKIARFLAAFSALILVSTAVPAQSKSPFRVLSPEGTVELKPGETRIVSFEIQIPEKHFIYKDKTDLEFLNLEGIQVKAIRFPASKIHEDPFFKKKVEAFEGDTKVAVTFHVPADSAPGARMLEALLKLQGCSDSLCYPEESHLIVFNFDIVGGGVKEHPSSGNPNGTAPSLVDLLHIQDFAGVMGYGWLIVLLVVFLGGFLTSLTPCVLPVIPITLMIIGVRAKSPVRRNLYLSFCLVLGLSLTYALLGVLAVALGKSLGFIFQEKWFVILLALLFFALSLSMFGLYEIHLPSRLRHRLHHVKGHGALGAFLSGAVAGFLAAPCAGPVVGSLLIYVSSTQSYLQGFFLLLIYALGMGVLFVVLGTGYGTLQARFKGFGLSLWIKRGLGVILLLGSFFYLNTVIPIEKQLTSFLPSRDSVSWIGSEPEGLERAAKEHKVMLIDFYADWCAPCKELEIGFFRKKEVVELLKQMIPVRVDATFSGDPEVEAVIHKYKVVGWPTIIFVGPDGKVLEGLTIVSYNPTLLLKNMQKALINK